MGGDAGQAEHLGMACRLGDLDIQGLCMLARVYYAG